MKPILYMAPIMGVTGSIYRNAYSRLFDGYDIEKATPKTPINKYLPKRINVSYADTKQRPGFLEEFEAFLNDPTACGPAARPVDSLSLHRLIENLKEASC